MTNVLLAVLLVVLPGPPAANTADDVHDRWQPTPTPAAVVELIPPLTLGPTANVEQWRGLAQAYFQPEDVDWALAVIGCESGGDPNARNPTSSATGLFQHLASYWPERAAAAGRGTGADIYDASAQFAVAAWLFYEGGGSSHWNASKSCWQ